MRMSHVMSGELLILAGDFFVFLATDEAFFPSAVRRILANARWCVFFSQRMLPS